jgi:hypothetical protein
MPPHHLSKLSLICVPEDIQYPSKPGFLQQKTGSEVAGNDGGLSMGMATPFSSPNALYTANKHDRSERF